MRRVVGPALVPVCIVLLLSCQSLSGGPTEVVVVPLDDRGWSVGHSVSANDQSILEFVLPGESVDSWTELLTVQSFFGAQDRFTPEQMMRKQEKATKKSCPGATWEVIRTSDTDAMFEWGTRNCMGWDDQLEISRYIRGEEALHVVRYTARSGAHADRGWTERIGDARIRSASEVMQDSVGLAGLTCEKPYPLSQDCSYWSGGTRKVEIEGFEVKIAGSADGTTVLVIDSGWSPGLLESGLMFERVDVGSVTKRTSFDVIKNTLLENDITISEVVPVTAFGTVAGYYLILGSDGYAVLKKHTK